MVQSNLPMTEKRLENEVVHLHSSSFAISRRRSSSILVPRFSAMRSQKAAPVA
jgi:hypothetical protein